MTYRDERDALRGRIQGLEQDLQEARRTQETNESREAKIERIEARMRETEATLHALRSELGALGGKPRSNKLPFVFAGIGVAVLVLAGMGTFLVARAPDPPILQHRPEPTVAVAEPVVPAPVPSPDKPVVPDKPVDPPARRVQAQWKGQVTRASGLPFGSAPCTVDATLEKRGDRTRIEELSVTCGGRALYRSKDKLEGMSMNSSSLGEEPGKQAGTFAYAVKYSDTGTRSGPRTQISLDSTHGQGVVWSEVVPVFRVEIRLPALSTPVQGERLLPDKPASEKP